MMWASNSFLMNPMSESELENLKKLDLYFKSVKDKSILNINFDYDNNYKMVISHDSMEIVGRIDS